MSKKSKKGASNLPSKAKKGGGPAAGDEALISALKARNGPAEAAVPKLKTLSCYQTPESATYAYRCGVYFDVRNKSSTRPMTVTALTAGAKGGDKEAVLYTCSGGSSAGNELKRELWREVWRGTLLDRTSTPIELAGSAVVVAPGDTQGFLLHSDSHAVWQSEPGHRASDDNIEILPGFRSTEARSLAAFSDGYLANDKATHAGSVSFFLGTETTPASPARPTPKTLHCYQTPESATYAYRCGVYFDVKNRSSEQAMAVTGLTAGAKGGDREAVLYACRAGSSAGNELKRELWREVWSGTLRDRTSTPIELGGSDVVVAPGDTQGFLLHSDSYAVWQSEPGHSTSDDNIEILPGFRSTEARSLTAFSDGYLASDKATHAGSMTYCMMSATAVAAIRADELMLALQAALTEGSAKLMRSKLSMVGEGRAGKTTTIKRMLGLPFDKDEASTVGAKTSSCEIDRTEACDFTKVEKDVAAEYDKLRKDAVIRSLASASPPLDGLEKGTEEAQPQHLREALETDTSDEGTDATFRDAAVEAVHADSTTDAATGEVAGGTSSKTIGEGRGAADTPADADNEAARGEDVVRAQQNFESMARAEAEEAAHKISDVDMRALGDEVDRARRNPGDEAKEKNLRLSVWDYGGQRVFYDLHHLFLTRQACYLIVFNMEKLTSIASAEAAAEGLSFLRFWLRSLKMHAEGAPILLVGTHKDAVANAAEHRLIHTLLTKEFSGAARLLAPVVANDTESLCFWPVDNSMGLADDTLQRLRGAVRTAVLDEAYVHEEVPVKWLKLLDALDKLGRPFVSFQEATALAVEAAGMDAVGLEAALLKFHEIGSLQWWSHSKLRQVVVLDPQWLVDSISLIIRDFELHKPPAELAALPAGRLRLAWTKLHKQAILTEDVLNALWPASAFNADTKSFLKELMLNMSIMCGWPTQSKTECFLVPSLLIPSKAAPTEELLPWSKAQTFIIDFSRFFLPTGCFERLVCMVLQRQREASVRRGEKQRQEAPPVVNSTDAWLSIDGFDFHLCLDELKQQIRCEVFLQLIGRSTANCTILSFVRSTLKSLTAQFAKNLRYVIHVPSSLVATAVPTPASSAASVGCDDVRYCRLDVLEEARESRSSEVDVGGEAVSLTTFHHWLERGTSGNDGGGIVEELATEKALARIDAMFRVGQENARRVMQPDIDKYSTVWDRLRLEDAEALVDLRRAADELSARCPQFDREGLRQPAFGFESTGLDNDMYMDALYEQSEALKDPFFTRIDAIAAGLEGVKFSRAPSLKLPARSLEKVRLKYAGDIARLRDVLRCKIVAADLHAAIRLLERLQNGVDTAADGFKLASVKLKLAESFDANSTSGGYRDLNINVFIPGSDVIAEVQVHLKPFCDAQEELRHRSHNRLTGHDRYVIYRRINERLTFQKERVDKLTRPAVKDGRCLRVAGASTPTPPNRNSSAVDTSSAEAVGERSGGGAHRGRDKIDEALSGVYALRSEVDALKSELKETKEMVAKVMDIMQTIMTANSASTGGNDKNVSVLGTDKTSFHRVKATVGGARQRGGALAPLRVPANHDRRVARS